MREEVGRLEKSGTDLSWTIYADKNLMPAFYGVGAIAAHTPSCGDF